MKTRAWKRTYRFTSLLGFTVLLSMTNGTFCTGGQAFADPGEPGGGVPALRDSISVALQELREIKALLLSEKNDPKATATVCFDLGGEFKAAGEAILDGRLKVEGFGGVDIYGTGLKLKPDVGGQARGVIGVGGKAGISAKVCVDVPLACLDEPQDVFINALTEGGIEVCGRLPEVAERLGWSPGLLQAKLSSALSQLENVEFSPQPGRALVDIRETMPNLLASMPIAEGARAQLEHLPEPPTSIEQLNPLSDQFMFEIPEQAGQLVDEVRDKAQIGRSIRSTIETIADMACDICGRVPGECAIEGCEGAYGREEEIGKSRNGSVGSAAPIELTPLRGNVGTSSVVSNEGRFGLSELPNPARPGVQVGFVLSSPAAVELSIYSVDGRRVRRLAAGELDTGVYQVPWDGADDSGIRVPSAMYFLRLVAPGLVDTKKITLTN